MKPLLQTTAIAYLWFLLGTIALIVVIGVLAYLGLQWPVVEEYLAGLFILSVFISSLVMVLVGYISLWGGRGMPTFSMWMFFIAHVISFFGMLLSLFILKVALS